MRRHLLLLHRLPPLPQLQHPPPNLPQQPLLLKLLLPPQQLRLWRSESQTSSNTSITWLLPLTASWQTFLALVITVS